MADNDICNKILAALSDSSTNVKKLRKQILLQLQTDSDDKVAKKKFKKSVQALESEGKVSLGEDGEIKLIDESKKDKKKKEKKKRKKSIDDGDDTETLEKKQKVEDFDADEPQVEEKEPEGNDEAGEEKNAPCPGNPSGYTRLFLGNLPFAVDEHSLRDFLAPAVMTHVKWITDKETGKFYGSAFIEMKTSKCGAIAVKEKNTQKLMGRPIRINFAPAREGDQWPPKSKEVTGNGGQAGGTGVKGKYNSYCLNFWEMYFTNKQIRRE